MEELIERIKVALGAMAATGPRDLRAYLGKPGPDFDEASPSQLESMFDLILSLNPNHTARLQFSDQLHAWDNSKDGSWLGETARNTAARRKRIYGLLKIDQALENRIDSLLPFFPLQEPLIIAEEHQDWYKPEPHLRDYYWRTYVRYLREQRRWSDVAVINLDNSTRSIVECLSNPESGSAYASRGLVMGYVQSGKTANFAGVVARAADAGYRLIVVLAGTWNILRNQTQRRFDKELLGKELLHNDDAYRAQEPADWNEFLEHGVYPPDLGHYSWQRLTRPDIDFKGLKAAIDSLEFEKRNKALPLYHQDNLHHLPVKLLVVKKNSIVLRKLASDLGKLRTGLTEIPALVIDDESDQAGLNTVDPAKAVEGKERTATNKAIVRLLNLLPRGQYVGYTATPYANALVNPDDPEDLFPKDFIITLERPAGYMGVSDFFDPFVDYKDLPEGDFTQLEVAFIRRVDTPQGEDDGDLQNALGSYLLAGALKLYRQAHDPGRYNPEHFKHHTMLIHTSARTGAHESLAARIEELWDRCSFNSPKGVNDLKSLWETDFLPVCKAQGKDELVPANFAELRPHLATANQRIIKDSKFVRVVNSDRDEAPDFTQGPVWKIIVGGNKLSRGYTVEGLTVSYYRRVANTGDTLMQMGRWFGFRPGYRDLVRVFLGVTEGKKGSVDLISLFKEVCRMEERFRDELKRYVRRPDSPKITPRQIPPLISISGNLRPTSRNKMFNAVVANKNFGGSWSMPTLMAARPENVKKNIRSLGHLLSGADDLGRKVLGGNTNDGKPLKADSQLFEATNKNLCEFLTAYSWLEDENKSVDRPADIGLQIEFLREQKHGIDSWLIMAPQRRSSFGSPLRLEGGNEMAVKERHRISSRGFQVFGESGHRIIAQFLTGVEQPDKPRLTAPNELTEPLRNKRRGVMLLYPVREEESDESVSVGFELLFPDNGLPFDLNFTVRHKADEESIVVQSVD